MSKWIKKFVLLKLKIFLKLLIIFLEQWWINLFIREERDKKIKK